MALSARFKELRSRLTELRKHFLPNRFSDTGEYSERQLDRARGYRLLVHAEIESYLEDISRDIVLKAIRDWKSSNTPSVTLVTFIASYHSSWNFHDQLSNEQIIEVAKSRKNPKESLDEIINLAQTQFISKVKGNHGIKEGNFKTLILPTGIDISVIDPTWLTNLDSFGTRRGEVAHKSKRTTSQINPQDEFNAVSDLMVGLKKLDRDISRL